MSLPLLYPETSGNGCAHFKSPSLLSHFALIYHGFRSTKEFKPHACTHHVFILVIIAMLTLCYSIMSLATLILYCHINIAGLLNIMCTLVATGMILGSLECKKSFKCSFLICIDCCLTQVARENNIGDLYFTVSYMA